jgi:hypothetical protein
MCWHGYEGGPTWKSGAWYAHPEKWYGMAELVREFGGAEDMLVPAQPLPAEVALLYSSSTDIWTLNRNHAYGFDRMHIWLALQHAQIPVDIVSERQAAVGTLKGYRVCYFSGPNLTQAAATKLAQWVADGGTLFLTANAGVRDEFNRPLVALDALLPADRDKADEFAPFTNYGSALRLQTARDRVRSDGLDAGVFCVQQRLAPRQRVGVLASFTNGTTALAERVYGRGRVFQTGFLPGLAYVQPALAARS